MAIFYPQLFGTEVIEALVAQRIRHRSPKPGIGGSNPPEGNLPFFPFQVDVSHFLTPGFHPAFLEVLRFLEKQGFS